MSDNNTADPAISLIPVRTDDNPATNEKEPTKENNFGFKPLEKEEGEESGDEDSKGNARPKKVITLSEFYAMQDLKGRINTLIGRYPGLIPRESQELNERLNRMTLEQLQNVYTNCVNDCYAFRGTPTAECVIGLGTRKIDTNWAPGFTRRCLLDPELRKDIEIEVIHILGMFSNRANIIVRMLNHLYKAVFGDEGLDVPDPTLMPREEYPFEEEDEEEEAYIRPLKRRRRGGGTDKEKNKEQLSSSQSSD